MSGHLRFGFAALLLVAGFSTPAASNSFTDLLSPNPAPAAAPATSAPAQDECLRQPGTSTAPGQHWVYRRDGHRKCWFQAAEDAPLARKPVRHHAVRRRAAAADEDEPAPRRPKAADEDARAQMLDSTPADAPQPVLSEPTLKIVHTVPVQMADAAGEVPPPPVLARPASDQPAQGEPAPRQVDVDKLLSDSPAASEAVASAPPATTIASPPASIGGGEEGMRRWLGGLLMVLGGIALLSSSRTLRRALWPVRRSDTSAEPTVIAHDGRNDPSFGRNASRSSRIVVASLRDHDRLNHSRSGGNVN